MSRWIYILYYKFSCICLYKYTSNYRTNDKGISAFPYKTLAMSCSFLCTIFGSLIAMAILKKLPHKFNILRVDINKRYFDEFESKEVECITLKM